MRRGAGVFYSIALCFAGVQLLCAGPSGTNRFEFRFPHRAAYHIAAEDWAAASAGAQWLKAWPEDGSTNSVQFGSRVVVQVKSGDALEGLTAGRGLTVSRAVLSNVFILQGRDVLTAAREADRLARLPEVSAAYPVIKRAATLDDLYAPLPNDPYYYLQWNLEHRSSSTGTLNGPDLNVRAAWPHTSGSGALIAIGDSGVELTHPELSNAVAGAPHFNFSDQTTNGAPPQRTSGWAHGTECAGLMVADTNNLTGMAGIAPEAQLASWIIFDSNENTIADDELMNMYEYQSNIVSVENHSWGINNTQQNPVTLLEQIGISNAYTSGRSGLGVVMVRAGGNMRT